MARGVRGPRSKDDCQGSRRKRTARAPGRAALRQKHPHPRRRTRAGLSRQVRHSGGWPMTRIDRLAAIQKGFAAGENAEHAKNAGSTGSTTCNSLKINDLPEPADGTHEFSL